MAHVVGVDARRVHIADATLIREAYDLRNLEFIHGNVLALDPSTLGLFDVVLCFGLLYHVDDPIGLLRLCRRLCKGICLIKTQVGPNVTGEIDWGSSRWSQRIVGSFSLIAEPDTDNPKAGISGISLVPSPEALLWTMNAVGFGRVSFVQTPEDAYEQHASGKRVMAVGHADS